MDGHYLYIPNSGLSYCQLRLPKYDSGLPIFMDEQLSWKVLLHGFRRYDYLDVIGRLCWEQAVESTKIRRYRRRRERLPRNLRSTRKHICVFSFFRFFALTTLIALLRVASSNAGLDHDYMHLTILRDLFWVAYYSVTFS